MTKQTIPLRVFGTPREITDDDLRGSSAVVIDVLRSSSTITNALENGARELIPVRTPAEAGELASRAGRSTCILAGERSGKRIEGFDLSNSPPEFAREIVEGRTIIFASTNGAPTIVKARAASNVYVGGYNNLDAVIEQLIRDNNPISLLCSGKFEQFSLEDFVCAGCFVKFLSARYEGQLEMSDSAEAAGLLYAQFADDILGLHQTCSHGAYLAKIGYATDLDYCAQMNSHHVLPVLIEGKLRAQTRHGYARLESTITPA